MNTLLDCGHEPNEHSEHTTGTAHTSDGREICWTCAAAEELAQMKKDGRTTLYFIGNRVTNLTGLLSYEITSKKTSRHNMGGTRTDFWFRVDGENWHGYQIGQWTEIAHCKRIK